MLRKPIVSFLGHVDSGKTSLQDFIRQSTMVEREAGLITQHIGASSVPIEAIKRICGDLLKGLKKGLTIPGLLFIDTPGHEAFTSLRKRGGSLADIAILVVDINEGFKPQTVESVKILMDQKTPFIVAANKLDLIPGWQKVDGGILQEINSQTESTRQDIDKKIYEILGSLSKTDITSERFDRVDDYTKQVAIVPVSAKTGEGIGEMLMVLAGLAQRYMEKSLEIDEKGNAKGTILEVKEEKGFGTTLDVIIYDGCLKKGDTIVIGGIDNAIVTNVKVLLEPAPLSEMRDKKSDFKQVDGVYAAAGVKVAAVDIDGVVAGMPIRSCSKEDVDNVIEEVQKEVGEVVIETDIRGVIVKSDALGSLEALSKLLKDSDVVIRKASIGNIIKKDIGDADSNYEDDPLKAVILGFNVKIDESVDVGRVKVITNNVIYKLIDDFKEWQEKEKKRIEGRELEGVVMPAKIELLKGYVFRQNNPAVVGVHVLQGMVRTGMPVMNREGKVLSEVKSIQAEQETVSEAEKGKQVAISLPGLTVGRQINEGDILYSGIPENDFKKLKKLKQLLVKEDIEILKEIAIIKRKNNPVWGV
ncbi:translation initiation factor IF-2 [Candidatus Woesearchaeota archaeon]|jgi:translation initiation factor 5B|nr:translation initiation factor IF-2 [Candidatus Woesearchaeota archaeon]